MGDGGELGWRADGPRGDDDVKIPGCEGKFSAEMGEKEKEGVLEPWIAEILHRCLPNYPNPRLLNLVDVP
jgi:hypothetical protein